MQFVKTKLAAQFQIRCICEQLTSEGFSMLQCIFSVFSRKQSVHNSDEFYSPGNKIDALFRSDREKRGVGMTHMTQTNLSQTERFDNVNHCFVQTVAS